MLKFPLWCQISTICALFSLNIYGVDLVSFADISKKINVQGNPFSSDQDVVILNDGRQIKGRVKKLPIINFSFGSISYPVENLAFISLEKENDRDVIRIVLRDGQTYLTQAPKDKFQFIIGNISKEIGCDRVKYILFYNHTKPVISKSKFHRLEFSNGDIITALLDKIMLSDGREIKPQSISELTFDGEIYGKILDSVGNEKQLEPAFVKDEFFHVTIPNSSKSVKFPCYQIALIKQINDGPLITFEGVKENKSAEIVVKNIQKPDTNYYKGPGCIVRGTEPLSEDIALPAKTTLCFNPEIDTIPVITFEKKIPEMCTITNSCVTYLPKRIWPQNTYEKIENYEITNVPSKIFDNETSWEISSLDSLKYMPETLFEESDDIPKDIRITYYPIQLFNENDYEIANVEILANIPSPIFNDEIYESVPDDYDVSTLPLALFCEKEICEPLALLYLTSVPQPVFNEESVEVPENIVITYWPIPLFNEFDSDLLETIVLEPFEEETFVYLPSEIEILSGIDFSHNEEKEPLFAQAEKDIPRNINLQYWPIREWNENDYENVSSIQITSLPIRLFTDNNYEIPYNIEITQTSPQLFVYYEAPPQIDIPQTLFAEKEEVISNVNIKTLPPIYWDESTKLNLPDEITFKNEQNNPLFSDLLNIEDISNINFKPTPEMYWDEATCFNLPDDIVLCDFPKECLYGKCAFGLPKQITIKDSPQEIWHSLDFADDIPREIMIKELPARQFIDKKAKTFYPNFSVNNAFIAAQPQKFLSKDEVESWNQKLYQWWIDYFHNERKETNVVDAKKIDLKRVTNADYKMFVQETGHRAPSHWYEGNIPEGMENRPVTNISYKDASNYAQWKGKRLPTAHEWQNAADSESNFEGSRDFFNEWIQDKSKNGYQVIQGNTASHNTRIEKDEFNTYTGFRCHQIN